MKQLIQYIAAITIIVVIPGCGPSKNSVVNNTETVVNTPLRGVYWKLTTLLGQPVNKISSTAFIKFNIDGKSVGGNGGCNTFGGSYDLTGSSHLSFGPIMSTKMYCGEGKSENVFFGLLSRTDSYLINGDTLFLRNAGMDSTAKFVADYLRK
jgi:heat shock protein HslJ